MRVAVRSGSRRSAPTTVVRPLRRKRGDPADNADDSVERVEEEKREQKVSREPLGTSCRLLAYRKGKK